MTIKVTRGVVKVDNARVVQANVEASNGVIHAINRVLMPVKPSKALALAERTLHRPAARNRKTLGSPRVFLLRGVSRASYAQISRPSSGLSTSP